MFRMLFYVAVLCTQ